MNWFKRYRLRRAREKYAYWKSKMEFKDRFHCRLWSDFEERANIAGKVAQYEERVESLMREP